MEEKLEQLRALIKEGTTTDFSTISKSKDVNEWCEILSNICWLTSSNEKFSQEDKVHIRNFFLSCADGVQLMISVDVLCNEMNGGEA